MQRVTLCCRYTWQASLEQELPLGSVHRTDLINRVRDRGY